jgi:hypothetical protein
LELILRFNPSFSIPTHVWNPIIAMVRTNAPPRLAFGPKSLNCISHFISESLLLLWILSFICQLDTSILLPSLQSIAILSQPSHGLSGGLFRIRPFGIFIVLLYMAIFLWNILPNLKCLISMPFLSLYSSLSPLHPSKELLAKFRI